MEKITLLLLALSIIVPVGIYFIRGRKHGKVLLLINSVALLAIVIVTSALMLSGGASAAEATASTASTANNGMVYISAALAAGLSAIGSGIAVASAASAALGAISENEKVFGKAVVLVGLAEGLAILGMVVALIMISKV
jgi:V/A-type H+-transporting ATPase subunit K